MSECLHEQLGVLRAGNQINPLWPSFQCAPSLVKLGYSQREVRLPSPPGAIWLGSQLEAYQSSQQQPVLVFSGNFFPFF